MSRVFITQNPMRRDDRPVVQIDGRPVTNPTYGQLIHSFDLTPAREYGDLHILLPHGPVMLSTDNAVRTLYSKLQGFTDHDHLLCLGDPVAISAASAMVSKVNNGIIPLLVYDRKVRKYLAIRINIHGRTDHGV